MTSTVNEAAITARIIETLDTIAIHERLTILHAVESGSRAWGFASRDSDYDVRFIYVRHPVTYLSLAPPPDTMQLPIDDRLDVNGWDLYKSLTLLRKNNPPLREWLVSPIVYSSDQQFATRFRDLAKVAWNTRGPLFHYIGMAKHNFGQYIERPAERGEEVQIKKYLYVLRPLLCALWIDRYQAPPPLEMATLLSLLDRRDVPEAARAQIVDLVARKTAGDELARARHLPALDYFLATTMVALTQKAAGAPTADLIPVADCDTLIQWTFARYYGAGYDLRASGDACP